MTTKQQFEGYFLIPSDFGQALIMVLEGSWKTEYERIIGKNNVTGLRLSDSAGWNDDNLDFLHRLPELTELEVYSWDVKDISPISSLKQLEHIGLECNYRDSIDFTALTKLQSCFVRWRPKSESVFSVSSLRTLNIVNYPHVDLVPLTALSELTELKLTSSKLKNLKGLTRLASLSSLDLYRCTRLESIDAIKEAGELKKVALDGCKKVHDLTPMSDSNKLSRVVINNCGKVQSLLPLGSCGELTEVFFIEDTNVEDGDLSFYTRLPRLKDMWFANRKHYSHTREKVQQDLESR